MCHVFFYYFYHSPQDKETAINGVLMSVKWDVVSQIIKISEGKTTTLKKACTYHTQIWFGLNRESKDDSIVMSKPWSKHIHTHRF